MSKETALITGASSGIGLELANYRRRPGLACVLVARSQDKLESLANDLTRHQGVEVLVLPKDLSDRFGGTPIK